MDLSRCMEFFSQIAKLMAVLQPLLHPIGDLLGSLYLSYRSRMEIEM